jgi:hypothetical protein
MRHAAIAIPKCPGEKSVGAVAVVGVGVFVLANAAPIRTNKPTIFRNVKMRWT